MLISSSSSGALRYMSLNMAAPPTSRHHMCKMLLDSMSVRKLPIHTSQSDIQLVQVHGGIFFSVWGTEFAKQPR